MITLNQAIEIFEQFSFKHKSLGKNLSRSNFYFGDSWEVAASGGLQYPYFWLSKLPTSIDKSGQIIHKFQCEVADKVNLDESNETHVLSDTEQICLHCINYVESIADSHEILLNIGNVSDITDFTEKRDEQVSGNYFTIELKSHQEQASCNLPIFDGTIFKGNYVYVGGTTSGNFVVQIKDQSGNVIQTFNTSGVYTVEILQQIMDTITANTSTIIQPL